MPLVGAPLHLRGEQWLEMVAHCLDGLPDEACGLIAGPPGRDLAEVFYPTRNADASSRTYTVDHTGTHTD